MTLVEQLHSLEPSADSAYYLGILNDKDGNEEEALKYYQESVALQTDNYKKQTYCIRLQLNLEMLEEDLQQEIMQSKHYLINLL